MIDGPHTRPRERQGVRRAVVFLPNGFTLANLFCGIYSIVLAARGNYSQATQFVLIGGIADALDGRVARATGTGSRFGEELDSLVDAISFGLAPAMIMFFAVLNTQNWQWLLVFIFTSCAVMRLARFNVEQAGRDKTYFHGLPSPMAGLTLATYYWFSQTPLYQQTVILFTDDKTLADLPWPRIMGFLMAILAALMISDVPYPAFPQIGWKNTRQRIGTLVVIGGFAGLVFLKSEFIFPALLAYVVFGLVQYFVIGLAGRETSPDELYWDSRMNGTLSGSDEISPPSGDSAERDRAQRRRKRRRRGQRPGFPPPPPEPPRDQTP
ncbi:MAG TPA: CDP-diacylglycerol--serine O-phosphatidyltransferase [Gemmatimonadaceae bacterium]